MILKYLVTSFASDGKGNPILAAIKYNTRTNAIEVGGKQKHFEYVTLIANNFDSNEKNQETKYYQKITFRICMNNLSYQKFKKIIETLSASTDCDVKKTEKLTGLM